MYTLADDGQRESVLEKRYDGTSSTPTSVTRIGWTYDALNRLIGETRDEGDDSTQNGNDYTTTYVLDLVGNRIEKVHDAVGSGSDETIAYVYDDRDRLVSEDSTVNASDRTYTSDANGDGGYLG
jgi:YD repeat-containing protein